MTTDSWMDSDAQGSEQLSLTLIVREILRSYRMILAGALAVSVIAVTFFFATRGYTATASFIPDGGSMGAAARMAGLAARFGLGTGLTGGGDPLELYAELINSRAVLEGAAMSSYAVGLSGDSATLAAILGVEADSDSEVRRLAVRKLRGLIRTDLITDAGVVRVLVYMKQAGLTEPVLTRILSLVGEHNASRRRSVAKAERDFTESRLDAAERELAVAEDSLRQFFERNREYSSSPQLSFEADRLRRQVDVRRDVQATLISRFEDARIEEVRTTPVFTLVDSPEGSERPAGSGASVLLIAAVLGAAGTATVLSILTWLKLLAASGDQPAQDILGSLERIRSRLRLTRRSSRG